MKFLFLFVTKISNILDCMFHIVGYFRLMILFFSILVIQYLLFSVGNLVYAVELPLFLKAGISELAFISLYTLIDKGNAENGWKFAFCAIIVSLQFLLPIYSSFLFYSENVQYFSVSIATCGILLNLFMMKKLVNKGLSRLLSSRISTSVASVIEISFFAYLLDIGWQGALMATLYRTIFILVVSKIVFYRSVIKN